MNAEMLINEAFMNRIELFGLEVAWPATYYAPKSDQPYLRPTMLFGASVIPTVGDNDTAQYFGVFIVDIFWPENDGLKVQLEKAMSLMDFFKKGTDLSTDEVKLRVQNKPYLSSTQQEPGWSMLPVNIPWRAFA